ncbi:MAG: hypothetical protein IPO32_12885 [Crocinitomicaceae bacterium]|nr:hypothetical protein [Crocinitomicaceae bacterium]
MGAWGGSELDAWSGNQNQFIQSYSAFFAIAISLYLIIKEALKLSDDDKQIWPFRHTYHSAVSMVCGMGAFFLRRDGFLPENFSQTPFVLLYLFLVPLRYLRYGLFYGDLKKTILGWKCLFYYSILQNVWPLLFLYPGVVTDASLMKPTAVQFMIIFFCCFSSKQFCWSSF